MKKLFFLLLFGSCLTISTFAQDKIYKGTIVKILEISSSDSYYEERAEFLGKNATALGDLTKKSDGYYSGTLEVTNGRTCFFNSVKVVKADDAKKTFSSSSLFSGTIPAGTKFKILEVPSDDAYYSSKNEIEGKTGTTISSLTFDADGYTGGSIKTDDSSSYYFYKVKLGKVTGITTKSTSSYKAPAAVTTKPAATTSKPVASVTAKKPVVFVTGTILPSTSLYVADISPDDSYYSDRDKYIGKRGKTGTSSMSMKEDGYYAGNFVYDDSSTGYFYKAKFSKTPVDKIPAPTSTSYTSTKTSTFYDSDDWDDARNDDDIYEGDKVEITAISTEDSYYDNKEDYIGKKGIAGDDLTYDDIEDGYGGTVTLEDGSKPYFYLAKMKKISSASSSSSTYSASYAITQDTRVVVTDLDSGDSFYATKSTYIGKTGKVAVGLTSQGSDTYSGKILFDDGTDAYFFKVKVTILK